MHLSDPRHPSCLLFVPWNSCSFSFCDPFPSLPSSPWASLCSHAQGSSFLIPFPSTTQHLAAKLRKKHLLSLLVPQPPTSWVFLFGAAPVFREHPCQCGVELGWIFLCLLCWWQALPLLGKGVCLQQNCLCNVQLYSCCD